MRDTRRKNTDSHVQESKTAKVHKAIQKILVKVGRRQDGAHDAIVESILKCDSNGDFTQEAFTGSLIIASSLNCMWSEVINSDEFGKIEYPFSSGDKTKP